MDITYRNLNLSEVHLFWDLKKLLDQEIRYMMYEPSERVKDEESLNQIEENIKSAIKKRDFLKVALNNNKLVGYLSAERGIFARNQHVAYLTIGVLKDYSGQGIAKKLFVLLDSWAKDNGIERIELTVLSHNKRAVDLYTHNGFVIEGVRKISMKIDGENKDEFFMAKYYH